MDGEILRARRRGLGWVVLALGLASCTPRPPVERLPSADETLAAAGKRLSRKLPVADLTVMAARGDLVLAALTAAERDALARGYLRFKIDRAAEVLVAAPRGSTPFWLDDQGFDPAGLTFRDQDAEWDVFTRPFGPGWVGLGVNGLDRKPAAHYAVFVRPKGGEPVTVSGLDGGGWDVTTADEGVSLASGSSRPAVGLPRSLRGSTLLRTSDDRRHSTMLARGRVWKTHVVSREVPDQVTVAFGGDPSAELVWSWRTSPGVTHSPATPACRASNPTASTAPPSAGGPASTDRNPPMPRSERVLARLSSADWRGWLALTWVAWFGLLYGRMVVEQRGGKLRSAVSSLAARPAEEKRPR